MVLFPRINPSDVVQLTWAAVLVHLDRSPPPLSLLHVILHSAGTVLFMGLFAVITASMVWWQGCTPPLALQHPPHPHPQQHTTPARPRTSTSIPPPAPTNTHKGVRCPAATHLRDAALAVTGARKRLGRERDTEVRQCHPPSTTPSAVSQPPPPTPPPPHSPHPRSAASPPPLPPPPHPPSVTTFAPVHFNLTLPLAPSVKKKRTCAHR